MSDKYTKKVLDNNDKYIVFYSDWCGYSMKAINLLKEKKEKFKGYKIDKIKGDMGTLLEHFKQSADKTKFDSDHRTRPIIFKNGEFLGGYSELQSKLN